MGMELCTEQKKQELEDEKKLQFEKALNARTTQQKKQQAEQVVKEASR